MTEHLAMERELLDQLADALGGEDERTIAEARSALRQFYQRIGMHPKSRREALAQRVLKGAA